MCTVNRSSICCELIRCTGNVMVNISLTTILNGLHHAYLTYKMKYGLGPHLTGLGLGLAMSLPRLDSVAW